MQDLIKNVLGYKQKPICPAARGAYTHHINISMDAKLFSLLHKVSDERNVSISGLIRGILCRELLDINSNK